MALLRDIPFSHYGKENIVMRAAGKSILAGSSLRGWEIRVVCSEIEIGSDRTLHES